MQKFGYLGGNVASTDDSVSSLVNEDDVVSAIFKVQQFAGLPPTGRLDNQTLEVCIAFFLDKYIVHVLH